MADSRWRGEMFFATSGARRLQDQGGAIFIESLIFFALMLAFGIFMWITCRISWRFFARARNSGRQSNSSHRISGVSGTVRSTLNSTDVANSRLRFASQSGLSRQQVADLEAHRTTGASWLVGVHRGQGFEEERRDYLEHALLDQRYDPDKSKAGQPNSCAICLDDYERGDRISQSFNRRCQHVFHHKCILDWLVTDDTCPCCRQNFLEFYDDGDDRGLREALDIESGGEAPEAHVELQDLNAEGTADSTLSHVNRGDDDDLESAPAARS